MTRTELLKIKDLAHRKSHQEEEPYDDNSDGLAILCVPMASMNETNLNDHEISVPYFYFLKMLKNGKIIRDKSRKFLLGDFKYIDLIGPVFEELGK